MASRQRQSVSKSSKPDKAPTPRKRRKPTAPQQLRVAPSVNLEDFWLHAHAPGRAGVTAYAGKWMLFVSPEDVDEVWTRIENATTAGDLGVGAKVATVLNSLANPRAQGPSMHAIMAYTRDCRDVEDLVRVLRRLRDMGFAGRLSYKEDGATFANVYGAGAALYVAQPGSVTFDRRREPFPIPVEQLPRDD